ncbi:MAG: hypothetical protein ABI890_17180 [Lapillicoccus sp.]
MSRHLGLQVSAYADRRLDAHTLRDFDRHVVACQVCRHAADQERRLLASLRHGAMPGLSEGLQSMLLGLAALPPVPEAPRPLVVRPITRPLPTVAPTSPPLHRSPRRAAMLAGFAASASAAAAIGLAAAAPTPALSAPTRPPLPRSTTSTTSVSADTTAFLTSSTRVGSGSLRVAKAGR